MAVGQIFHVLPAGHSVRLRLQKRSALQTVSRTIPIAQPIGISTTALEQNAKYRKFILFDFEHFILFILI